MSSFSCSHFNQKDYCNLLSKKCLPGIKGCVLKDKVKFAFPIEVRLQKQEEDKFKNYRRKKNENKTVD